MAYIDNLGPAHNGPADFPNFDNVNAATTAVDDATADIIEMDGDYEIDLTRWKLTLPTDNDGDGSADEVKDDELSTWNDEDNENFTVNDDGSITFTTAAEESALTETSTYRRSELREMIRAGDTGTETDDLANNWVLDSASSENQEAAGGVNGTLSATLQIDQVTVDGNDGQIGRVIIGQIHGEDNEPIRLYYHKAEDSDTGQLYFAHEPADGFGDETWHNILDDDPIETTDEDVDESFRDGQGGENGIALGEVFSYDIAMDGTDLSVVITKEDGTTFTRSINIEESGYGEDDEYLYFKAGVYEGNNSSEDTANDYSSATFYDISVTHEGNYLSEDDDD